MNTRPRSLGSHDQQYTSARTSRQAKWRDHGPHWLAQVGSCPSKRHASGTLAGHMSEIIHEGVCNRAPSTAMASRGSLFLISRSAGLALRVTVK